MALSSAQIGANLLLAGLPSAEAATLRQGLERVDLRLHDRLAPADKAIRHVYFPGAGMISLVQTFKSGDTTEVGLIGREGFWGTPILLGVRSSPVEAMVQAQGWALRMTASDFTNLVRSSAELRARCLRYAQLLHVQVAVTAACNAQHQVRQRLARWLLEAQDRLGGDVLTISHEFLSFMLGVRRAGVTAALSDLKSTGCISTSRGMIGIVDRNSMQAEACECYGMVLGERRRLFPGAARSATTAKRLKSGVR